MFWCEDCSMFMDLIQLGITVPWGKNGDIMRGDRYICQTCGKCVVTNFGEPYNPRLLEAFA